MQITLEGKGALITGGSRGLGRAMAQKFAESGGDVVISARRPEVLEETKAEIQATATGKVHAAPCDVTDPDQIKEMFAAAAKALGQVDILVNNAGTSSRAPFEDITDEMWEADLNIKLFAAIRTCRLALPPMKERRWGRILNVTTIAAKAPRPESAPTAVTRAAGLSFTKVLAGEAAPYNVLVNALCTGRIITDQVVGRHKRLKPDMPLDDFIAEEGKSIPLGRMGNAEEYANVACFLASDAASYITGAAVNIDGGMCPIG